MAELTERRREVLELLAKGLTNSEISRALHITSGTVRTHVTELLAHLDVSNRTEAAAAFVAWEARPARVAEVMGRPAIAVLPLVVQADDPRARTVAAGIADDLTTLLARWCWFPVIASASATSARTLGSTGREIAERLGARFLVDGTLRVSGNRFRLSIRIDAPAEGHCLWAERFDFPTSALFEVQDDLCNSIVAAAYPVLVAHTRARLLREAPAGALEPWELAHSALALQAQREKASNAEATARFGHALEREPGLVLAHFGQGLAAYDAVLNQWGEREAALDRLARSAESCVALSPHGAEGHYLVARHAQALGDSAHAVLPLETAITKNPSFAVAHALLAQVLAINGDHEAALARMEHAVRLSPFAFVAGLANLYFIREDYAQALDAAERAVASNPRYTYARVLAVAAAWWLQDAARAQSHLRQLRGQHRQFQPQEFLATFGPQVGAVERIVQALAALGAAR